MKSKTSLAIIFFLSILTVCHAQAEVEKADTKVNETINPGDSMKQMNFLDEQTKIFGSIFSTMDEDNPLGGATNYLELLETIEMPAEERQQFREMYELYDASLDPRRKEELKVKVNEMLKEAMAKGNNEN